MILIGREVLDYVVEEELGEGGMAVVLRARDRRNGRVVALKLTRRDADIRAAERTGAELQQRLSEVDPRVPCVHEIREADGRLVIAMEFVDGEDLAQRIARGDLDAPEAARIARELCEHLTCAQRFERGIVHGDIKPRNVRVSRDGGAVKVLDFGIAKALSETRQHTRNAFSSPAYASPERLETNHVDVHSDLWAVACVLFEMLAGRPPYDGEAAKQMEDRIRQGGLGVGLPPTCPPALVAILRKALARRAADRYPSPAAMSADLAAYLAGRPTVAEAQPLPSPYEETRRTARPSPEAEITRRTEGASRAEATTRRATDADERAKLWTSPSPGAPAAAAAPAPADARRTPRRVRIPWRWLPLAVIAVLAWIELAAWNEGRALQRRLPGLGADQADVVWADLETVRHASTLQLGSIPATQSVLDWFVRQADGTVRAFRSEQRIVREREWTAALALLDRAARISPEDRRVNAYQAYCRGQIARINAEAAKGRKKNTPASRLFAEAEGHFDRAAALRPGWPDPLYGLARTYAYGLEDPERTKQTLDRAMAAGFESRPRYFQVLGDAHTLRGERLLADAASYTDRPEEAAILERAKGEARSALECFQNVPNAAASVKRAYDLLDRVQARESERALPFGLNALFR